MYENVASVGDLVVFKYTTYVYTSEHGFTRIHSGDRGILINVLRRQDGFVYYKIFIYQKCLYIIATDVELLIAYKDCIQ